jgi:hypothetical protein
MMRPISHGSHHHERDSCAPSPQPPGWKLSNGFKAGDKLVLCNATLMYVVTVDGGGVNDAASTLTFAGTPTPVPIYDPATAPAASVTAARFRTARWYLDAGSLYTSRNGVAQAVVPGVTALNVSFRRLNEATYTPTPANWTDVVAVRVNLALRGQQTTGGDVQVDGSNFITRTTSNITAVRSTCAMSKVPPSSCVAPGASRASPSWSS